MFGILKTAALSLVAVGTLGLAAAGNTLPASATTGSELEWDSSTGCPVGDAWSLRDISGIPAKFRIIKAVANHLDKNDDDQLCIKVKDGRLKAVLDNKPIEEPEPTTYCEEGGFELMSNADASTHLLGFGWTQAEADSLVSARDANNSNGIVCVSGDDVMPDIAI